MTLRRVEEVPWQDKLYSLQLKGFIAGMRAEAFVLWLMCFYIMIEYIRPHSMYSFLNILPWGLVSLLACFAGAMFTKTRAAGFGAMDKMFIFFSILVILSGVFAWDPSRSLRYWTTYMSWMLMYFCMLSILNTPQRVFLFVLFFLLINFKLSQHGARVFAGRGFSFAKYGIAGSPGWFHNSGELALQMVVMFSMATSILLTFREHVKSNFRWYLLMVLFSITALLTVIGSSSRGGQLALAAVLLVMLFRGGKFFKKLFVLAFLAYGIMQVLPEEQLERFSSAGDDKTSQSRLEHWEHAVDTLQNNPMGIGYKNWIPYYYENYQPKNLEQIHNTVLEAFVDLGYLGGVLFLLMLTSALIMNSRSIGECSGLQSVDEKIVYSLAWGVNLGLIGTFIAACFMSVLFYPMFWFAFALTSILRHLSRKLLVEREQASKAPQPELAEQPRTEQQRGPAYA